MSSLLGFAVAGTDLVGILNYWADIGVFSYVLPFLLVFAVVYGILAKVHIFGEREKNKGVNAVIAIAVGLLSLQWDYVPTFFSAIFPYAGMGISVLLVALILMGLFGGEDMFSGEGWQRTVFFIIGAGIAAIVVLNSLTSFNWYAGWRWSQFGPALITLAVLGGLIALVIGGGGGRRQGQGNQRNQHQPEQH